MSKSTIMPKQNSTKTNYKSNLHQPTAKFSIFNRFSPIHLCHLSYFCEISALILTLVYTAIVAWDIYNVRTSSSESDSDSESNSTSELPSLITSKTWYSEGFCVWRLNQPKPNYDNQDFSSSNDSYRDPDSESESQPSLSLGYLLNSFLINLDYFGSNVLKFPAKLNGLDSHLLCFYGDVLFGFPFFLESCRRLLRLRNYRKDADSVLEKITTLNDIEYQILPGPNTSESYTNILLGLIFCIFNLLHALGHLSIYLVEGKVANLHSISPTEISTTSESESESNLIQLHTVTYDILRYFATLIFLSIGPFMGRCFGTPKGVCLFVHLLSTYIFAFYLPVEFSFGGVLMCLNFWWCIPRLIFIHPWNLTVTQNNGISKNTVTELTTNVNDQDIDNCFSYLSRSKPHLFLGSIGILLLMPIVFFEALSCDTFFQSIGGHFWYDFSTVITTNIFCIVIWWQTDYSSTFGENGYSIVKTSESIGSKGTKGNVEANHNEVIWKSGDELDNIDIKSNANQIKMKTNATRSSTPKASKLIKKDEKTETTVALKKSQIGTITKSSMSKLKMK